MLLSSLFKSNEKMHTSQMLISDSSAITRLRLIVPIHKLSRRTLAVCYTHWRHYSRTCQSLLNPLDWLLEQSLQVLVLEATGIQMKKCQTLSIKHGTSLQVQLGSFRKLYTLHCFSVSRDANELNYPLSTWTTATLCSH